MHVLPSTKVTPLENTADLLRIPKAYRYDTGGAPVEIPADRIIHIREFSPLSMSQGTGAGEALRVPLALDEWAQRWNISGFKGGGSHMRMIFKLKGILASPDLKKRALEELKTLFAGADKAREPILLDGDADAKPFGNTHQDLEFPEMLNSIREQINAATGVPPSHSGILQHANYSNMGAQDLRFWEGKITPKTTMVASYLDQQLLPRFGLRGHKVVFDTSGIRVLRENVSELLTTLSTAVQYAIATPNEAIRILRTHGMTEFTEYPEGNDHFINNGLGNLTDPEPEPEPVPLEELMGDAEQEEQETKAIEAYLEEISRGDPL
jgi:HK97 family phage portal protein